MRRVALTVCFERLRWERLQLQEQYRLTATSIKVSPGLVDHCRLVQRITESQNPEYLKRKRIRGVLRKMETNHMEWLEECGPRECVLLLKALAGASRYLGRDHSATMGVPYDDDWSGASPHFSPGFNDWLCAALQRSAQHASGAEERIALLAAAAELELADTPVLQQLCQPLTSREYTANASPADLVSVLRVSSLLVKRCRMPLPPLNHVLFRLMTAKLDSRQSLTVLSSLLRLRERHGVEVVRAVSRRATDHVATYTPRDVVYALEAIALLNCCHEAYTGAVLDRCTELHAVLQPTELGSICKYVAMLNSSRTNNDAALSCAKELRRLLPALLNRTEQLLGRFSLRDARCILRCFEQHKIHHSVVFSRLTPLTSGA
ncbi:hypothetical protein DQ04_00071060 [Trypanosoma grayi]|uniref:hypothetical protein n=1 Tax=Trypanosoma grayi TaxID=71804 RepID=UPI0004F43E4D|nr:hypothetical protein DQ04_00071060 [Trypanosoma grayi]KEG15438.1 hypothetical protein DQ04_00071060 [Trypanosoma grayi]